MFARSLRFSFLSLSCACLALPACNTVSSAPEGSPRVEAALRIDIDSSFQEYLDLSQEEVEGLVHRAVFPHADMGLRLYPVLEEAYAGSRNLPEYYLRVEVSDFAVALRDELVTDKETDTTTVIKHLEELTCRTRATFERVRSGAPVLVVGRGNGTGAVSSWMVRKLNATDGVRLHSNVDDGAGLRVPREKLGELVEEAAVEALRELTRPMDREFERWGD